MLPSRCRIAANCEGPISRNLECLVLLVETEFTFSRTVQTLPMAQSMDEEGSGMLRSIPET